MPELFPNYPVRIASGDAVLIASGVVTTFGGRQIEVSVANLKIVFAFVSDVSVPANTLSGKAIDAQTIKIVLTNFDAALGAGSKIPIEIGQIAVADRPMKLFLHFEVHRLGESIERTLQFCIYYAQQGVPTNA